MTGKRVPLSCGHEGEHVLGGYVECEVCDEKTEKICLCLEYYETMIEKWNAWHGYLFEHKTFCRACGAEVTDTTGRKLVGL